MAESGAGVVGRTPTLSASGIIKKLASMGLKRYDPFPSLTGADRAGVSWWGSGSVGHSRGHTAGL